jgi:hypothetical protein
MTAHQSLATVDSSPVFEINATLTPRETVNELDKYILIDDSNELVNSLYKHNRYL